MVGAVEFFFFFQAEDCIRDGTVTGVQTCALPIMVKAEHWEPYDARVSRTVLGARRGAIPRRDSLPALPPGPDLRPPGRQPGSLDAGRLGGARGLPAAAGA